MDSDRLISILMLIVVAVGVLVLLKMPFKYNRQGSSQQQEDTIIQDNSEAQVVSIPFSRRFGVGISQTVVFKTTLMVGTKVNGRITVDGGDCVTFFVMDTNSYREFLQKGRRWVMQDDLNTYISMYPTHSVDFQFTADKTADYFVVIQNTPQACHDKLATLEMYV